RAFDLERLDLLVLDENVLALGDLITLADVVLLDRVAGLAVDQLLPEAVAGLLVDAGERHPLRARCRRLKRRRARGERKPEGPLPIGARGHAGLLVYAKLGRRAVPGPPHGSAYIINAHVNLRSPNLGA